MTEPKKESAFDPFAAEYPIDNLEESDQAVIVPPNWKWVMHDDLPLPEDMGYWSYDLEAIPDVHRFSRPDEKIIEYNPDLDIAKAMSTVPSTKAALSFGICDEQIMEMLKLENERPKPRAGVLEICNKFLMAGDEPMANWRNLAKNPATAAITAMAICPYGDPVPRVWLAKTRDEERELVKAFFEVHAKGGTRVGYNISAYDDRLIVWRALQLGVLPIGRRMTFSRYGGKGSIDLMAKLFSGIGDAMKLKTVLSMLEVHPPAGDVDGSMVADMVYDGHWELLANYVASDAWSEMQLLLKMQQVLELI
jgi:hypothetical protein